MVDQNSIQTAVFKCADDIASLSDIAQVFQHVSERLLICGILIQDVLCTFITEDVSAILSGSCVPIHLL